MFQPVAVLALVSAFFYCVAMIAMKSWAEVPNSGLIFIVAVALLAAGTFEAFALQQERLGMIYVGILGAEVLFLGAFSFLRYDEAYSARELAGMGLVLVGTSIAWT